jgi:hypothetical protein
MNSVRLVALARVAFFQAAYVSLAQQEEQRRAANVSAAKRAREQRRQLREKFEPEDVSVSALQDVFGMVEKAVASGEKEVMALHFPSDVLADSGRSIITGSRGFAARAGTRLLLGKRGRHAAPWDATAVLDGILRARPITEMPAYA